MPAGQAHSPADGGWKAPAAPRWRAGRRESPARWHVVEHAQRRAVEVLVLAGIERPQEHHQPQQAEQQGQRDQVDEHRHAGTVWPLSAAVERGCTAARQRAQRVRPSPSARRPTWRSPRSAASPGRRSPAARRRDCRGRRTRGSASSAAAPGRAIATASAIGVKLLAEEDRIGLAPAPDRRRSPATARHGRRPATARR